MTALIVGILSCLTTSLYLYILNSEKDTGLFIYAFIMIFGNIILPIFFVVCLYAFLKRKIKISNKFLRYFAQVGMLILISILGVCFMTISNVISYYSGLSRMTFQNLKDNFDSSYRGYTPEIILYTFLIPLVYYFVEIRLTIFYKRINV